MGYHKKECFFFSQRKYISLFEEINIMQAIVSPILHCKSLLVLVGLLFLKLNISFLSKTFEVLL